MAVLNLRWLSLDYRTIFSYLWGWWRWEDYCHHLPNIWVISEFWTGRIATIRVHQGVWTSHGRSSPVNHSKSLPKNRSSLQTNSCFSELVMNWLPSLSWLGSVSLLLSSDEHLSITFLSMITYPHFIMIVITAIIINHIFLISFLYNHTMIIWSSRSPYHLFIPVWIRLSTVGWDPSAPGPTGRDQSQWPTWEVWATWNSRGFSNI